MQQSILKRLVWLAWLGAAPLAGAVVAAAQPQPPTPSAGVTPAQLAALAFPGWSGNPAGRVETVTLPRMPGTSRNAGHGAWNAGANRVLVEPKLVMRIDATHLTLIAGLVPSQEGSQPAVDHTTPMALAAYQFEQRGGTWAPVGRQGVFALRGFFGEASVRAVPLAAQRQAIAVEYGSCWQGNCGTWMALYELDKGVVRQEPVVETTLSGINVNAVTDCSRRLQPLIKPPPQDTAIVDENIAPDTHDCYAIESSWSIDATRAQPGDLLIHYRGAISRADAHAAPPSPIDQRQVLRYGSGKYRAVSGFNPVPPI
jgi:hypothetical protein